MRSRALACSLGLLVWCALAAASLAEDGVEPLKEGPPKEIAADVAKALAETGYRVTADGKAVCDVWLAKQWTAKAKFSPSLSMLYPLESGELIGVVRYPKRAADYRDQQIRAGVYTLRYGLQPEDGNHVGTSTTRDFLVLLPAAKDSKPERLADVMALFKQSAEVSRSTHPAILAMVAAEGKEAGVRHIEDRELWTVRLVGKAKTGDRAGDLAIEFVVVGHAKE